ncbi:UNVERIFIED_CONTAM: CW-type Zinc Finger protein [Hammondia hammondi]|eukprot:XP_008885613.1 CW-type Zinc Finger protein [Hammondia hammondi]
MRSDGSASDHSSSPALASSAHPASLAGSQLPPGASFTSSLAFPSFASRGLSPALLASGALQQHHQAAAGAAISLPLHLLRLQQSALAKQQALAAAPRQPGTLSALLHANRLPQTVSQREVQEAPGGGAAPEKVHWVQCDRCDKWRVAPFEINASTWVCAQNTWDPRFASCSAPEETNVEAESSSDDGRPQDATHGFQAAPKGSGVSASAASAGPSLGPGKVKGGQAVPASKSCAARGKKAKGAPAVSIAGASPPAAKKGRGRKTSPGGDGASRPAKEAVAPQAGPSAVDLSSAASALMAAGLPFSALQHAQTQQLLQHPLLASGALQGASGSGLREARAGLALQQLQGQRLLQQIHSYAQSGATPAFVGAPNSAQLVLEHWVQCDSCNKWRRAPAEIKSDKWFCYMNTWAPQFASCDAHEEPDPEAGAEAAQVTKGAPGGGAARRDDGEASRGTARGAQKRQRSAAGLGAGAAKTKAKAKAKTEKADAGAVPQGALEDDQVDTLEKPETVTEKEHPATVEGARSRLPGAALSQTSFAVASRTALQTGQRAVSGSLGDIPDISRSSATISSSLPSLPTSLSSLSSQSSLPPAPVPGSGRSGSAGGFAGRTVEGKPLKWHQCTSCSKWRRVPEEAVFKNDRFCCYMNVWSAAHASCAAPQEPWQAPAPGDPSGAPAPREGLSETFSTLVHAVQNSHEAGSAESPGMSGRDPALAFPTGQLNPQQRLQLLLQLQSSGANLGALSLAGHPVAALLGDKGADAAKPAGADTQVDETEKAEAKEEKEEKDEEEQKEEEGKENESDNESSDDEEDDEPSQGGSGAAAGTGGSGGDAPSGGEASEKREGGDDNKGKDNGKTAGEKHESDEYVQERVDVEATESEAESSSHDLRPELREKCSSPTSTPRPLQMGTGHLTPLSPLPALASPLSPPLCSPSVSVSRLFSLGAAASARLPRSPRALSRILSLEEDVCERRAAPSTPSTEASAVSSGRGVRVDWTRGKADFASVEALPDGVSPPKERHPAWSVLDDRELGREARGAETHKATGLPSSHFSWFRSASALASSPTLSPSRSPFLSPTVSLSLSSPCLSSPSLSSPSLSSCSLSSRLYSGACLSSPVLPVSCRLPPLTSLLSQQEERSERRVVDCLFSA